MSRWARFRQTFRQPAYRTRLAFFLILGFTVVLLSVLIEPCSVFWSQLLLEFAVTFGAVGVLELLWDFLGGEPMELRIEELKDEVRSVRQSTAVLSDLMDGNIGLERIWPDRQAWQEDPIDGRRVWDARVRVASRVDIMSNTLWNNWMHRDVFRRGLFGNIAQGAHARILIYDPDSTVLEMRATDEEDAFIVIQREKVYEMQAEVNSTLSRIAEEWNALSASARSSLEVRLTAQTLHLVQMIRADDRMLVGIYLSGKSGTPSPTVQLRGTESCYFQKYIEQFETLWRRAMPVSDDRLSQILQEYDHLPAPPTED